MSGRVALVAAVAAAIGLAGCVAGVLLGEDRIWFSYLTAFAFLLTVCVGCLVLVMIAHAARARWITGVRRIAELPMAMLPVFLVLVVPVLLGMDRLYPWVPPIAPLPPEAEHAIHFRREWMNVPFFVVRSFGYLLLWSAFAVPLAVLALRQDERGFDPRRQLAMQRISSAGLPVVGLSFTFAAFDWLMSLEPVWLSTIYGLYVSAGALGGAAALVAAGASLGVARKLLPDEVGAPHLHATGKLLFALTCFWGWMAYSQLLVIWSADVPREIEFYLLRSEHGWGGYAFVMVAARFALPFGILLSRDVKLRPATLGPVAGWVLLAHYLDVYWLVIPRHAEVFHVHWLDPAALLLCGGVLVLCGALAVRLRGVEPAPRGDAYFLQALRYRGS